MSGRPSRRTLLVGAGAAGLAAVVAACSAEPPARPPVAPAPPASPPPTTTTAPATWTGDAQAVALCAAISSLAASLYGEAAANAGRGSYGTTPAVVTTFLTAAGDQHAAHLAAWNQVLSGAGAAEVEGAPLTIAEPLRVALDRARAPVDLAMLAVDLERRLAATVTAVLGEITYPPAVQIAAGIGPVAAMRQATAQVLAGGPPEPDDDTLDGPTRGAVDRSALDAG